MYLPTLRDLIRVRLYLKSLKRNYLINVECFQPLTYTKLKPLTLTREQDDK